MKQETINEHIRNGLSPLKVTIDIIRTLKEKGFDEKLYNFLLDQVDVCNQSIERLCLLGTNSYEKDADLWRNSYN